MAVLRIDTLSDGETPYYRQTLRLEDRTYILVLQFNFRTEVWATSLFTENDTPIVLGQNVLPGRDILRYSKSSEKPPGKIVCLARTAQRDAPKLKDLGTSHALYYFTSDEDVSI